MRICYAYILPRYFANISGSNLTSTEIFLDATDLATEGTFRWTATDAVLTYTNWDSGEPNNAGGGNEHCVMLASDTGLWNDVRCYREYNSVCEI